MHIFFICKFLTRVFFRDTFHIKLLSTTRETAALGGISLSLRESGAKKFGRLRPQMVSITSAGPRGFRICA